MEKTGGNGRIIADHVSRATPVVSPSHLLDGPFLLQELLIHEGGLMKETSGMNIISIEKVDVERTEGELDMRAPRGIETLLSKWLVRAYARRYNDGVEGVPYLPEEVPVLARSRI